VIRIGVIGLGLQDGSIQGFCFLQLSRLVRFNRSLQSMLNCDFHSFLLLGYPTTRMAS